MNDKKEEMKVEVLLQAFEAYGIEIDTTLDYKKFYTVEKVLAKINDKYSRYYTPSDMDAEYLPYIKEDIVATGILLEINDNRVVVKKCIKESEAYENGIREGTEILRINNKPAKDYSILQIYLITKKRPVLITFLLNGIRKEIVLGNMCDKLKNGIEQELELTTGFFKGWAYIKLLSFNEDVEKGAVAFFTNSPDRNFIIDLRDNEGGFVKVCLSILNSLLQNGAEIGILKCGKREEKIRCINSNRFQNEKMIILINEKTASVAEWFASAIQCNGGIIIGKKSFGKGLIQTFISFGEIDGSGVKFSIAEMLMNNGESIEGRSIYPDIYYEEIDEVVDIERVVRLTETRL